MQKILESTVNVKVDGKISWRLNDALLLGQPFEVDSK